MSELVFKPFEKAVSSEIIDKKKFYPNFIEYLYKNGTPKCTGKTSGSSEMAPWWVPNDDELFFVTKCFISCTNTADIFSSGSTNNVAVRTMSSKYLGQAMINGADNMTINLIFDYEIPIKIEETIYLDHQQLNNVMYARLWGFTLSKTDYQRYLSYFE